MAFKYDFVNLDGLWKEKILAMSSPVIECQPESARCLCDFFPQILDVPERVAGEETGMTGCGPWFGRRS